MKIREAAVLITLASVLMLLASCTENGGTEPPGDDLEEGILYTVAGIPGQPGNGGNGGPADEANLAFPQDVAVATDGKVYIVDYMNHCIRLVNGDGTISRFAGSGVEGDDVSGQISEVDLDRPANLAIGAANDLWISDWKNCKIKRIDLATMTLSTPVGTVGGFYGDGGPANQARLDLPSSALFGFDDNTGYIFPDPMYVSDQKNHRIRVVDAQNNIETFVGSGVKGFADGEAHEAQFSFPDGPDPVPGGRITWGHHPYGLLVADTENNRIRFVLLDTKQVFTIAGTGTAGYSGDGARARECELNYPTDILMTIDHEIFIADAYNHVIRKIDAVGMIHTVVGTGTAGNSPDGTPVAEAMLNSPSGIGWDEATRTLYIADSYNHQVKKVRLKR